MMVVCPSSNLASGFVSQQDHKQKFGCLKQRPISDTLQLPTHSHPVQLRILKDVIFPWVCPPLISIILIHGYCATDVCNNPKTVASFRSFKLHMSSSQTSFPNQSVDLQIHYIIYMYSFKVQNHTIFMYYIKHSLNLL